MAAFVFEKDIILEHPAVLLRPFRMQDLADLESIALDQSLWQHTVTSINNPQQLLEWGKSVSENRLQRERYTFVIVEKQSGKVVGSTGFLHISEQDKRLEIGSTFLGKACQGSGLNKICKFLLFSYVFETLQFERAELKTDVLNLRSRKAMLKVGATEEGILRSHTLMHDGRRRDTIYYSILKPEWETIKQTIFADLLAV